LLLHTSELCCQSASQSVCNVLNLNGPLCGRSRCLVAGVPLSKLGVQNLRILYVSLQSPILVMRPWFPPIEMTGKGARSTAKATSVTAAYLWVRFQRFAKRGSHWWRGSLVNLILKIGLTGESLVEVPVC
jgi:hypothetical protein